MKISFYGAAQDVTGSNFLVETKQGERFIIDCGMYQGSRAEERQNARPFPYKAEDIDFVVLTHAHIDHSGRLPKFIKDGYRKRVHMTPATRDLVEIMLADSASIQDSDARWENRQRQRSGKKPVEPLYTQDHVERLMPLIDTHFYGEVFSPTPHIKIRFSDAGHILGSSIVEIWAEEDGETNKLVFSGDLGMPGHELIADPANVEAADTLILESTYGNTTHGDYEDSLEELVNVINKVTGRGGTVVIPSFAVGRTQELLYELNKYYEYNKVPTSDIVPIYIDSPLAARATGVFMRNTDALGPEAKELIRQGDNIFRFPNLVITESVEDSKALNNDRTPKVIISASGMATGGRVRHHLKHTLWDKKNAVVFVGYQAAGTLGRILLDGTDRVKIMGSWIDVRAEMYDMEGFSAHADRPALLDWVDGFKTKPSEVILVHGEMREMKPLADTLEERFGMSVKMPEPGDTIEIMPGQAGRLIDHGTAVPSQKQRALSSSLNELQALLSAWEDRDLDLEDKEYTPEQMDEIQRTINILQSSLMDLNMQTGS